MFLRSGALFAAAGGKVVGAKGLSLCGWGYVFRGWTRGSGGRGDSGAGRHAGVRSGGHGAEKKLEGTYFKLGAA